MTRHLSDIPKIELHVHLEGSIEPEECLRLSVRNGVSIGASTIDELRRLYQYEDFSSFLNLYGRLTFVLVTPSDFTDAVIAYGRRLAEYGGIYAEMTVTLGTHVHFKGLNPEDIMAACRAGAERVESETSVVIRFIIDHVRSFSVERCIETVEWCHAFRKYGVVGVGLAGPEAGWPASIYREALRLAERLDIPFVPHVGEAAGPDSVWDALQYSPRRIGHGLSVARDSKLINELKTRGILIEVCPTSNVVLGHVGSYARHPARSWWESGVPICLNSDDPPMFGTSLANEYAVAAASMSFSAAELRLMNQKSVEYVLASEDVRSQLRARF